MPQFSSAFPGWIGVFTVNEKMSYAIYVIAIYTFAIWFYFHICEPMITYLLVIFMISTGH